MCSHSPPGIPDADRNVQAKKYGFSCYSDGKCAIYPKEEQAGVDGIARDDMWVDAPAGSPRA